MEKTLTLRKCAYLFDSSYGTYFYGTKEQHAKRNAIRKAMEAYYWEPSRLIEKIPYTISPDGQPEIIVNGEKHRLNALQIAHIDGDPESVINHRRHISVAAIAEKATSFHMFCRNDLYSNKFKTLQFEFFTGPNELGYIRVSFKTHCEKFIVDDRTGELFTAGEYGPHKPTTAKAIRDRLDITTTAATREFYEIINIITEAKNHD